MSCIFMKSNVNTTATETLINAAFGGGGRGGRGRRKSNYGASSGTTFGSYKDGAHMSDHGGIKSAVAPAAQLTVGAITGGAAGAIGAAITAVATEVSK